MIRCRKAKFLSNQKQRYEVLGLIRGGTPRFLNDQKEITELQKLADRYRNLNILNEVYYFVHLFRYLVIAKRSKGIKINKDNILIDKYVRNPFFNTNVS